MMDEHGNPVLHRLPVPTREGVKGAPAGWVLTNANTGRAITVTEDMPLDPEYVEERDRLTTMKARAAKARAAKEKS